MTARDATLKIIDRLHNRNCLISFDDAWTLRRAELTLQRWAEAECGNSSDFASYSLERDEATGKPFRVVYWNSGKVTRTPTPDREAGALRRIAAVCEANGLHYFHQTDPRGCALYVSDEPLTGSNYTNGVACCA